MSETKTITYYHNYDQDKINELESNSNIEIIKRDTEAYDTSVQLSPFMEPHHTYIMYRTTFVYKVVPTTKESPRQDTLMPTSPGVRVPKTRGGTDEFISAFWIKGKPKCRRGYRYDFNKKMCRLIK